MQEIRDSQLRKTSWELYHSNEAVARFLKEKDSHHCTGGPNFGVKIVVNDDEEDKEDELFNYTSFYQYS